MRWLFVSRFHKDVTADELSKFLKEETEMDCNVEVLKPKIEQADYTSFKVGVPEAIIDHVMRPDFWPKNVFVNRFFFPKKGNFTKIPKYQQVKT